MQDSFNKTLIKAIGLGNAAGIRAAIPLAILSEYYLKNPSESIAQSKLNFIQTPTASVITKVWSVIEMSGDKLPGVPNRTFLPEVIGRISSGALTGAVIFGANKENITKGALIGGVSALAATYVSFFARKFFGELFSLNEPAPSILEDALVIGGGTALLRA